MLTSDTFLPPLLQLSHPASLLTSIGFRWEPSTGQMTKLPPKLYLIHSISTRLHLTSILLILLQTALYSDKSDLSKMMISSFGLIVIVFCGITVQVYRIHLDRAVRLINELIGTSEDLKEKGNKLPLDTKEKLIKLLAPTFHWSAMAVPFAFVGGVVWSMPCMPSNLGYFFLTECSSNPTSTPSILDHLSKLLFITSNLWIWSYGVQCAVFVVIVVMLGAMSIRSFLKLYLRQMLEIGVKPSTTTTPWSNSSNSIKRTTLLYRRLQLLTSRFNSLHALKILVPLLFTVTSHQIFSVYSAIKFSGSLNLISYALFLILGSQGVLVIMGMFTGLADVYTMSTRVKGRLERAHRGHKYLRRFHMSCTLIKIRFGSMNYIDSFTPLAFENFALVQTTNILMT